MSAQVQRLPSENEVLSKALLNSKEHLGLTNTELGEIIGKDRTYFTRLRNHNVLEPNSKEGELALHVIRIYRSLYALEGGDLALDPVEPIGRASIAPASGMAGDEALQGAVTIA